MTLLKLNGKGRALLLVRNVMNLLQSRILMVLWSFNTTRLSALAIGSGSLYGLFALLFGGFSNGPMDLTIFSMRVMYTFMRTIVFYLARGRKPLHPGWTLSFEIVVNILHCCVQNSDRMMKSKNAKFLRQQGDLGGTALGYFACQDHGTYVQPVHVHDLEHLWIRSKNASISPRRRFVLLYYHGGAFTICSPRMYITFANWLRTSICEHLVQILNQDMDDIDVDVFLANYRKLPEHSYPSPQQDAYAMYNYVVHSLQIPPQQIILGGDSAGAALVMSTMLRVRDQGAHNMLPLGGILSCPFVDRELKGDDLNATHCYLNERATQLIWDAFHPQGDDPTTWGDVSPVHCDLTGLPPVLIQAGELDCILPHAKRLMKKAEKDGLTTWQLDIQPNVPHVFSNFPASILPQATEGIKVMAAFAAKRFAEEMEEKAIYA